HVRQLDAIAARTLAGLHTHTPVLAAKDGAYEEYRLTEKGHAIYPILMAIRDWGDTYMSPDGPPVEYRHKDCTGEAHVHLTCDDCAAEVTARDIAPEPGPGITTTARPA
ncbi:winged helix-turn-helix transcriptional regulator, partial [Gordonia aichiensis]